MILFSVSFKIYHITFNWDLDTKSPDSPPLRSSNIVSLKEIESNFQYRPMTQMEVVTVTSD